MTRLRPHQLPIVARLHEVIRSTGLDDLPDADLLDRFARYADHPAFEVLLQRHGPMVFGVCRRLLSNPADVEDAFQATFLVLVRKARTVTRGDRLAPWLYGVAYRVALKARCRAAQAAVRWSEVTDMIPDPTPPAEITDWLPILDAELNAIPAKYRDPLVLCELQGISRANAAKVLKIPEGTLSSRLARGRELLRKRLLKHGTLLPAGGLTTMFATSGVGRAAVPTALLAKTSELVAIVATGAVAAGVVPVGTARLTDEVIKSMFLAKLRVAGGAILAAGLIAVGLLAALPAEAPGQPKEQKPTAKANPVSPSTQPPANAAKGGTLSDREALQGLWVVTNVEQNKFVSAREEIQKIINGKMRFLVVGDIWWEWRSGEQAFGYLTKTHAKIEPNKNPKWLDLQDLHRPKGGMQSTYELNGDKLRICASTNEQGRKRPAELQVDENSDVMMFELVREKMPPAAGDKALVGSWDDLKLEILDGFLFTFVPNPAGEPKWIGGRYTVDVTKNPKWIDVDLFFPYGDEKATKIYGSYEVNDGGLKLALGLTGKRSIRPLDLNAANDVLFFDVLHSDAVSGGMVLPLKRYLALPEQYFPPTIIPKPLGIPEAEDDEHVRGLMKDSKFDLAETYLRERLASSKGLRQAEQKLYLSICLVQRAGNATPPEALKLREEGLLLVRQIIKEVATDGDDNKRAKWLVLQAELRILQILQQLGKSTDVLLESSPLLVKYRGTVDELIVLSLMYHAYKQKGDINKALETRDKMKELFDRLPAAAFTATSGEYSRAYWEKTWFADPPSGRP